MPTIFCVGKNYADHVREMGDAVEASDPPVVFLKPWTALVHPPDPIRLPTDIGEIQHEVEVVVRVGADRQPEQVALGLDLTARTLQGEAKRRGLPWAAAKGFRGSAPVGPFVPVEDAPPLDALRFTLTVNGKIRQRGDTATMIRPVPTLLEWIDDWFGLAEGDLVFTGTPEGVGPLGVGNAVALCASDSAALGTSWSVVE